MINQAKLILDDVLELPLTSDQVSLVADLLASHKRDHKAFLFLALTDSFVAELGRGVAENAVAHRRSGALREDFQTVNQQPKGKSMLNDTIFDHLYHPSEGTEQENVEAFLKDIEWYSDRPLYGAQVLQLLKQLAQAYLESPSFVAFQKLHRSAIAFMRFEDSQADTGRLNIENGELRYVENHMTHTRHGDN